LISLICEQNLFSVLGLVDILIHVLDLDADALLAHLRLLVATSTRLLVADGLGTLGAVVVAVAESGLGALALSEADVVRASLVSGDQHLGAVEAHRPESFQRVSQQTNMVHSLGQIDVSKVARALLHGCVET